MQRLLPPGLPPVEHPLTRERRPRPRLERSPREGTCRRQQGQRGNPSSGSGRKREGDLVVSALAFWVVHSGSAHALTGRRCPWHARWHLRHPCPWLAERPAPGGGAWKKRRAAQNSFVCEDCRGRCARRCSPDSSANAEARGRQRWLLLGIVALPGLAPRWLPRRERQSSLACVLL